MTDKNPLDFDPTITLLHKLSEGSILTEQEPSKLSIQVGSIGVVIVNHNSGPFLKRCLVSLLKSDASLHIVVVDNDSTDSSLSGVKTGQLRHHRLDLIENPVNVGFSAAVNIGAKKLNSEYIMLLNPDSEVHPDTLSGLQAEFDKYPNAGIIGPLVFNTDGTEQNGCRRNEPTLQRSAVTALGLEKFFEGVNQSHEPLPVDSIEVDAVSGSAMMIHRERFIEIGKMDESYFLHCEDLDICRRCRDFGYEVLFCPFYSVFHQQGVSGNVTKTTVEKHKHDGMLNYYRKHQAESDHVALRHANKLLIDAHMWFVTIKQKLGSKISRNKTRFSGGSNTSISELVKSKSNKKPVGRGKSVLLSGAKSDVGDYLINILSEQGYEIIAVTRKPVKQEDSNSKLKWLSMEFFEKVPPKDMPSVDFWVNLAPIWTVKPLSRYFSALKPKKVLALSSTSIEVKTSSSNKHDQELVKKLEMGEKWLAKFADKMECSTIILRPTMIYGGPRNQNINMIEDLIRFFRVFPMVGAGNGLRQPVHAQDIALACSKIMVRKSIWENQPNIKEFNLGGGEIMTYKEMVARIFQKHNRKPVFLPLPASVVKAVISVMKFLPGMGFLTSGIVDRLNQDLVFENQKAEAAFGYRPGKFVP